MLRITHSMLSQNILRDLNRVQRDIGTNMERLASTKRITRPSDDPYGTGRALGLAGDLKAIQQHRRNVQEATSWTEVTDVALGQVSDVILRARDLLVRAASGTMDQESRAAIATEIDQLAESAKEQAAATYDGRYVLAGTATGARPYAPGSDAFLGDSGPIMREIGAGVTVAINVSAGDLLGSGAAAGDGKLLDVLRGIAAHLRSGAPADTAALGTTDLRALDAAADAVGQARAAIGSTANRLALAGDRLWQAEESATRQLSEVEDADIARTLIDLTTQQATYEAALKAGARLVQPSLLDFLR
jgi:flagellar hook-associated protein 3 FlgL